MVMYAEDKTKVFDLLDQSTSNPYHLCLRSEWLSELVGRWRCQMRLLNVAFPPNSTRTIYC